MGGESANASNVIFEGCNPIFRVASVAKSVDYYVRVLGFKLLWDNPGMFACVARGKFHLFLSQGDQGNPGAWVWVGVSDAEGLHREYLASGARIRHRPANYSWAYEMQVEDLDGNILRMGSEPKEGEPDGEWLDMRGQVWARNGKGEWVKVEKM